MKRSDQIIGEANTIKAVLSHPIKNAKQALKWFMNRVKSKDQKDENKANVEIMLGHMYLYAYDPKTKEKMKYWDARPLVIPISYYDDGFLGINLHYLPPAIRVRLLRTLIDTYSVNTDEKRYMRVSYEKLAAFAKAKAFQPCLKRYLFAHVRTKPKRIPPSEWLNSVLLPTASWRGASSSVVYKDSMGMI